MKQGIDKVTQVALGVWIGVGLSIACETNEERYRKQQSQVVTAEDTIVLTTTTGEVITYKVANLGDGPCHAEEHVHLNHWEGGMCVSQ